MSAAKLLERILAFALRVHRRSLKLVEGLIMLDQKIDLGHF